jgi:2'-5' RNA ligase
MKRIFIAVKIEPDANFRKMISSVRSGLSTESVKWTDTANIHLTLVFLGDTDEAKIPVLDKMLKERCTGTGSFEINIKGLGVFRNLRDPKVLWAGIDASEKLAGLNKTIVEGLKAEGFQTEERAFSPHLTIGRIRRIADRDNLQNILEQNRQAELQKVLVSEVILYESVLKPTGSVYIPLGTYCL